MKRIIQILVVAVIVVAGAASIPLSFSEKAAMAAPVDAHDRTLIRALERQSQAQEEQAAALKAIERHLAELARKVGR
jgi:hypothetical protein